MRYGQQPKLKLTYRYFWIWLIFEYAKPDTYASRAAKIILYFFGYRKNLNGWFFYKERKLVLEGGFVEISLSSVQPYQNPVLYRAKNKGVMSIFMAAILSK